MKRKTMKTLALMLVSSMILAVTGCGQAELKGDLLARIRAKGELVIATEGTWAPWTYHDENDKLVGFYVELVTKIA